MFDVTGAGDTVISVLAAALAAGEDTVERRRLANLAAGIVVGKLGTAVVSATELRRAVQREQGRSRGAMNLEQLTSRSKTHVRTARKVVFTNGCFDILHAGHVGYLQQARALGDRLIVAVNSRCLGVPPQRPRPPDQFGRSAHGRAGRTRIGRLGYQPSTKTRRKRCSAKLRPDILVKGGDYSKQQVVGWEIVEGYGGQVRVLSFFDDMSTTKIVEKILEKNPRA